MRKKTLTLKQRQAVTGLLFICPWIVGFIFFFAYNLIQTISFSFNEITFTNNGGYDLRFIGLDNYIFAFTKHATFNRELTESVINMLIDVPLVIFFSLFIAIILNRKFKGRGMVRAIFFLPVIMSTPAIIAALASNLQNLMGGLTSTVQEYTSVSGLNANSLVYTLVEFGFPIKFVDYIIEAVARVYEIVGASGVQIIIFLAALQAISPALYEVADIEGATKYESFWKITFPMVGPLILTNVVYTIVDMYSKSEIIEAAQTTAFSQMNFGLSATMSVISAIIVSVILLFFGNIISKKIFYHT